MMTLLLGVVRRVVLFVYQWSRGGSQVVSFASGKWGSRRLLHSNLYLPCLSLGMIVCRFHVSCSLHTVTESSCRWDASSSAMSKMKERLSNKYLYSSSLILGGKRV